MESCALGFWALWCSKCRLALNWEPEVGAAQCLICKDMWQRPKTSPDPSLRLKLLAWASWQAHSEGKVCDKQYMSSAPAPWQRGEM